MPDPNNPIALGYFMANDPASMKMREKLALAMMVQKRKVPQNLGEGIYSVGQDIGDAIAARQLMQQDRDAQLAASKLGTPADPGAITPLADASDGSAPPPIAAAQPSITPPMQQQPAAMPATPLPPDQQQSDAPGAPIRMPSPERVQDFRNQNPLPRGLPPVPGAAPQAGPRPPPALPTPEPLPARPSVADYGQKPILAPTPPPPDAPVMAQGGDDPRRAAALAMLRQGQTGQSQSQAFAPAAASPSAPPVVPDQGIRSAPPMQVAPGQPAPITGYVTPEPSTPAAAPIIKPTRRERELTAVMAVNQGNPYAASSPAANELQQLVKERELRQTEQNELFKERAKQQTELIKLRETGRMDQAQREATVAETKQKLVDYGQNRAGNDPRLLGTDRSPQRTGIPMADPPPPGVIPVEWAKDQAKKISATQEAYETTKPELSGTLDLLENIRTHAGKSRSIGPLGGVGAMTAEGRGFAALNEQLKGKNLVAIYQKVKGTGPVGEREGENLAKAQAALTTAGTEKDYDKALDTLETTLRGAVERTERKLNRPVTAYQRTPNDPYAPDIGQIDDTWRDGRVREYIGGDPRDKNKSWKIIR